MAAVARPRIPFGELSSSRVQALESSKNTQNAVTDALKSSKQSAKPSVGSKRSYTPAFEDEDFDAENVNPVQSVSKRAKSVAGLPMKKAKPTFNLKTIPAGRTPPGKSSKPPAMKKLALPAFKRIDPPALGMSKMTSAMPKPFSIDAALAGTATMSPTTAPSKFGVESGEALCPTKKRRSKKCDVAIYNDTPLDAAAVVMQHCTGILNLTADGSPRKDDVGKENIAPPDYEAVRPRDNTTRRRAVENHGKVVNSAERRAALAHLIAADFYGEGLDANSVEIVDSEFLNPTPIEDGEDDHVDTAIFGKEGCAGSPLPVLEEEEEL